MKIASVSPKFFEDYGIEDDQLLLEDGRPCVIVSNLNFMGESRSFAVPLRSNIAPKVPKEQYFKLPPRPKTKPGYRHGVHYSKMFPVDNSYLLKYRKGQDVSWEIIDKNAKDIISECQNYLERYEQGEKPLFSVDIGKISNAMKSETT